jgi:hypothetical protein
MPTKTFKIGEYARGGVITAIATKDKITIIGKEWDFSTGSRRSSNQSNAKEFTRLEVNLTDTDANHKLENFLNDLTTYYYTRIIMQWIQSNSTLKPESMYAY